MARTIYLTRASLPLPLLLFRVFVRVHTMVGLIKRPCVWKKIKQTESFSF